MTLQDLLRPAQAAQTGVEAMSIEDLLAAVDLWKQGRLQQEIGGNVGRRRQELVEQGALGPQPLANRQAAYEALVSRLPLQQRETLPFGQLPQTVQEVPGIGRKVGFDDGTVAMTGRYGTGTAQALTPEQMTNRPEAVIDGMPASKYFREAAIRQGTGNKFADIGTERVLEAMKRGTYKAPSRAA